MVTLRDFLMDIITNHKWNPKTISYIMAEIAFMLNYIYKSIYNHKYLSIL